VQRRVHELTEPALMADVYQAHDLLADLQHREIIVRTTEAARGRTVEYGAGPKLPRLRPSPSGPRDAPS
jgi:hypothetical protein